MLFLGEKGIQKIAKKVSLAKKAVDSLRGLDKDEKLLVFEILLKKSFFESEQSFEPGTENIGGLMKSLKGATSFVVFLKKARVKSQADKVLCATYFCLLENKKAITLDDIKEKYSKALLKKSKNLNAEINSNISKGYMMQNDKKINSKKSYSITQDGISYLEEKLSGVEKSDGKV